MGTLKFAIEIKRRGNSGVLEEISIFFKMPMTRQEKAEKALHKQEDILIDWLK